MINLIVLIIAFVLYRMNLSLIKRKAKSSYFMLFYSPFMILFLHGFISALVYGLCSDFFTMPCNYNNGIDFFVIQFIFSVAVVISIGLYFWHKNTIGKFSLKLKYDYANNSYHFIDWIYFIILLIFIIHLCLMIWGSLFR